jgi:hypothetical protein
MKIFKEID